MSSVPSHSPQVPKYCVTGIITTQGFNVVARFGNLSCSLSHLLWGSPSPFCFLSQGALKVGQELYESRLEHFHDWDTGMLRYGRET